MNASLGKNEETKIEIGSDICLRSHSLSQVPNLGSLTPGLCA